ncbi:hypothetical protein [Sphingomonas sp.]|uniref:hypothetical protein n=1 Tax=Sphingomonas sp. TaxID=28214 RepID=UPI001DD90E72|nr:hypothetical protein [Sphingomonas sp.]MBX9796208.1 hypothetical protein [Sphingomonas sp.]
MRTKAIILIALLVSACNSKPAEHEAGRRGGGTLATESSEGDGGPRIAMAAAPGVAFSYNYFFRIAGERVQRLQESHAQACEALGVARCRIVAMRYDQGSTAADAEGSIDFNLDPGLARKFASQGIDALVKAGGTLGGVSISGEDAAGAIDRIDDDMAPLRSQLAQIESDLARLPPRATERDTLRHQADDLRQRIDAGRRARQDQSASLATTPVRFAYQPDNQGWFSANAPLGIAVRLAQWSFGAAATVLLAVLAGGLPWLAIFALGYLAWRTVQRHLTVRTTI